MPFPAPTSVLTAVLTPEAWHAFFSQPDGRDKVLRLIQYVCKLLRWLDDSKHGGMNADTNNRALAAKASSLESALATTRQAGRLFKWTSMYVKSRNKVSSTSVSTVQREELLSILSDVAMLMYFITDNSTFAAKFGIIIGDVKKLSKRGARFWFIAIVSNLLSCTLKFYQLSLKEKQLKSILLRQKLNNSNDNNNSDNNHSKQNHIMKEEDAQVESNENQSENEYEQTQRIKYELHDITIIKRSVYVSSLKQICDAAVACNGAFEFGMNQAFVGLCGTISSAIGIRHAWPKIARDL